MAIRLTIRKTYFGGILEVSQESKDKKYQNIYAIANLNIASYEKMKPLEGDYERLKPSDNNQTIQSAIEKVIDNDSFSDAVKIQEITKIIDETD